MTTEWDNTPWAGETVKALTVTRPSLEVKAVTGAGVQAYSEGILLSSLRNTPQERAAAYLRAYKFGWFYKAESKISGDLATLPWTVSDGDIESDDPRETEIGRPDLDVPIETLNPIEQFMRLMERPNPRQTGRQLRQKTFIRRDMAGCAFWYLEAAGPNAPITAIYGISPSRLWPAYDRQNQLLGYVLDKDSPSGGTPFETWEIVPFSNTSADEDDIFGVGVVEAVYAELPLTDLLTRHTADLLSTGGRLAGMLWPKDRALNEDEFTDAQRAWRNVVSDGQAARRLLLFPEPMEYASGASTPKEIGIPELAALNRDNILTAFPISPYMLGVPTPGGLNSGEVRKEDRRDYWEGTIEPRITSFDEIVQTNIISRYEALMGQTFRFETNLPRLDDAPSLLEKAGAFRSLVSIGFDPKDIIKAVGLDHIKWTGLPDLLDPAKQAEAAAAAGEAQGDGSRVVVTDSNRRDNTATQQTLVGKATKSRADIVESNDPRIRRFLSLQRDRVIANISASMPRAKAQRGGWVKADPDWWDADREDAMLRETLSTLYVQAARGSLQVVADTIDGIIPNRAVGRIVDDLAQNGAERITGINEHTREAVQSDLAEGTRRGYSLNQIIEGVPSEEYRGLRALPVFDDARAETIARTETMLAYNRAALDAYREFNVREVIAYDGDKDPECADRDGRTFSVDDAFAIADHPNGTLDWAPVVEKAYHEPVDHMPELIAAIQGQAPPVTNVFIEPAKDVDTKAADTDAMLKAVVDLTQNMRPVINASNVDFPVTIDTEPFTLAIRDLETTIKAQPAPVVNVPPAQIVVTPAKAQGVQDVRIVDDVSPPKVKRVLRGKPTRQYPEGPIQGVVEE